MRTNKEKMYIISEVLFSNCFLLRFTSIAKNKRRKNSCNSVPNAKRKLKVYFTIP